MEMYLKPYINTSPVPMERTQNSVRIKDESQTKKHFGNRFEYWEQFGLLSNPSNINWNNDIFINEIYYILY